ncbi:unnamed protein product, partial [Scytosiphon promiscuus]
LRFVLPAAFSTPPVLSSTVDPPTPAPVTPGAPTPAPVTPGAPTPAPLTPGAPTPAPVTPVVVPATPAPVGGTTGFTCDGVEKGEYCCTAGCGECGGSGCGDRGSGLTAADCCQSSITGLCSATGAAPCIIDDTAGPTPTPPTPVLPTPAPVPTPTTGFTCDGVQSGDYCCTAGCGECGGSGCRNRGPGLTGEDCCQSSIFNLCSATGAAPCVIDDAAGPTPTPPTPVPPTAAPVAPTPTPGFTCDGVEKGDFCCSAGCGECGGSGCGDRGSGLTAADCCQSSITGLCSATGAAPCIIDDAAGPTPTPPTPAEPTPAPVAPTPVAPTPTTGFTCDGVEKGDYCCSAGCGECGGSGCGDRGSGLTAADCCQSSITGLCSATGAAPCIIDGAAGPTPTPPTPAEPTPAPVAPTPTTGFTCDGVQSGDYCCTAGCGECGGSGCRNRGPGLTGEDCCQSSIFNL